jgi:hypothetical protein
MRQEGLSKFKNSPDQVLNPRPSDLQHSALITMLLHAPKNELLQQQEKNG